MLLDPRLRDYFATDGAQRRGRSSSAGSSGTRHDWIDQIDDPTYGRMDVYQVDRQLVDRDRRAGLVAGVERGKRPVQVVVDERDVRAEAREDCAAPRELGVEGLTVLLFGRVDAPYLGAEAAGDDVADPALLVRVQVQAVEDAVRCQHHRPPERAQRPGATGGASSARLASAGSARATHCRASKRVSGRVSSQSKRSALDQRSRSRAARPARCGRLAASRVGTRHVTASLAAAASTSMAGTAGSNRRTKKRRWLPSTSAIASGTLATTVSCRSRRTADQDESGDDRQHQRPAQTPAERLDVIDDGAARIEAVVADARRLPVVQVDVRQDAPGLDDERREGDDRDHQPDQAGQRETAPARSVGAQQVGKHQRQQQDQPVVLGGESQPNGSPAGHVPGDGAGLQGAQAGDQAECDQQRQQRVVHPEVRLAHEQKGHHGQAAGDPADRPAVRQRAEREGRDDGRGAAHGTRQPRQQVERTGVLAKPGHEGVGRGVGAGDVAEAVGERILGQQQVLEEGRVGERQAVG